MAEPAASSKSNVAVMGAQWRQSRRLPLLHALKNTIVTTSGAA
jgi:hypothetical protein